MKTEAWDNICKKHSNAQLVNVTQTSKIEKNVKTKLEFSVKKSNELQNLTHLTICKNQCRWIALKPTTQIDKFSREKQLTQISNEKQQQHNGPNSTETHAHRTKQVQIANTHVTNTTKIKHIFVQLILAPKKISRSQVSTSLYAKTAVSVNPRHR